MSGEIQHKINTQVAEINQRLLNLSHMVEPAIGVGKVQAELEEVARLFRTRLGATYIVCLSAVDDAYVVTDGIGVYEAAETLAEAQAIADRMNEEEREL